MTYRTYRETTYSNAYSTGTSADGGITYHQVGSRGGQYYRRVLNLNGRHRAVAHVELVDAELGLELVELAGS